MSATINYSTYSTRSQTVKTRPMPGRRGITLEELLRRAAASVERGPVKLIAGRFRPVQKGRALTRLERGLILLMVVGLGLAIWLHALSAPVSAHTAYFQSLAASTSLDATAPRPFTESALRALGHDWRPATLFANVHPAFWHNDPAVRPNTLAENIEGGLGRLAEHGPAVSAMVFNTPSPVGAETINGVVLVTCRVAGQLELADGVVVRFAARLVQDERTKHWGIMELSLPPFVP